MSLLNNTEARSPEMERLVRIESKLSRLMENVGVNPQFNSTAVNIKETRGAVEAHVTALAASLGEILSAVREKFPHAEEVWVVHRGMDVCRINVGG